MTAAARPSAAARGYNSRWQKARVSYLARNPLCVACRKLGRITAATVVDHIVPHRGDRELFWASRTNWQPLCKTCHDRKTAREDGGFGREASPAGCDMLGMPLDPTHPWHRGGNVT